MLINFHEAVPSRDGIFDGELEMDKSDELYKKYSRKQADMSAEIARLEAELAAARDRENLVKGMLADMEMLQSNRGIRGASTASVQASAPAPVAAVVEAPVVRSAGPGRGKGRAAAPAPLQRAAVSHASAAANDVDDVGDLSIVDAAIQLAHNKGVKEAKASDVHGWFEEAGYQRRNGVPNRNSIYVSLNREANQTADSPDQRIRKDRRGVFCFL